MCPLLNYAKYLSEIGPVCNPYSSQFVACASNQTVRGSVKKCIHLLQSGAVLQVLTLEEDERKILKLSN